MYFLKETRDFFLSMPVLQRSRQGVTTCVLKVSKRSFADRIALAQLMS